MQISRHWRMQRWRYRLELEAPMSHNREHQERRQFGALGVIHRNYRNADQLLVLKDEQKTETVAGLSRWAEMSDSVWSFPGGGRGMKPKAPSGAVYPENVAMTLSHEIQEELGVAIQLIQTDLRKQAYPFLAAQLRLDQQKTDEFAVTSAQLEYDQLSKPQQRLIATGVERGDSRWVEQDELRLLFLSKILFQRAGESERFTFRPHALMAAFLWFLQDTQAWSSTAIERFITPLNQKTHAFIYADADKRSRLTAPHRVNNGAFQSDGQLIPSEEMDFRDRRYLYPQS